MPRKVCFQPKTAVTNRLRAVDLAEILGLYRVYGADVGLGVEGGTNQVKVLTSLGLPACS